MYCGNCGKQLCDESKFCPECGSPVESDLYEQVVEVDCADNYDYIDDEPANVSKANKLAFFLGMIKDKYKLSKKLRIVTLCIVAVLLVGCAAGAVINNFNKSKDSGLYSTLENSKKLENGLQFSTEYELHDFLNDYIIASDSTSEKYGVIDFDSKEIIPFSYDNMKFADGSDKSDLLIVVKDDKCGAINSANKTIIDFKYDAIGCYDDYDRIYALDLDKQTLYFFTYKGKQLGKFKLDYDKSEFAFYGSSVYNSKVNFDISGLQVGCFISNDTSVTNDFDYDSQVGLLTLFDITSGEVKQEIESNSSSLYEIIRLFIDGNTQEKYYCHDYNENDENGLTIEKRLVFDINGNKVDDVQLKNSKGKKLSTINTDEFYYIKLLDDSGVCLVIRTKPFRNGDHLYSIENINTNEIIYEFDYYEFDDENEVIITRLNSDSERNYAVYSYSGEKIYELTEDSEVIIVGADAKGFWLDIKDNYKFVSYDSSSDKLLPNGMLKYGVIENLESKWVKPLNYIFGFNSYNTKDIFQSTVCYPYIESLDNQYCILSINGDIIVDFGLIEDIENINLMANTDGICFKVDNDVYWYNQRVK